MGRNAKPIELLEAEGRKHLTKEEIQNRKKNEIRFGDHKLKCPEFVKSDLIASKKWREITALYKEFNFVGSGDSGLLARYCKSFSEYQDLLASYQRIKEIHYDMKELDEALDGTYLDDENEEKRLFSYKVKKQLRDMISVNALLSIEAAINKKMDMLIKMEDRLFLNPLAKVRNVPKQEEEKPPSRWGNFGGGMSG
ncbi:MAG: terminase [Ruminococcaceae bacterium]|nr:terminase [Oscillospiraceae bacterium]